MTLSLLAARALVDASILTSRVQVRASNAARRQASGSAQQSFLAAIQLLRQREVCE